MELWTNEDGAMCCACWKLPLNSHKLTLQQGKIPTINNTQLSQQRAQDIAG